VPAAIVAIDEAPVLTRRSTLFAPTLTMTAAEPGLASLPGGMRSCRPAVAVTDRIEVNWSVSDAASVGQTSVVVAVMVNRL
jgi:hypothetical protein